MRTFGCRFPHAALTAIAVAAVPAGAQTNPLARFAPPALALTDGRWNGVDLERRTNCASAQSNGNRGTYAQFDVSTDAAGNFGVVQSGITGLNCNYIGRYQVVDGRLAVQGNMSCSDGKQGAFQTTAIDVSGISLDIQFRMQLSGNETCSIEGLLGLSRLGP
ncbi:MAG: hypothetical protein ABIR98_02170 [Usitatibacter sp.]